MTTGNKPAAESGDREIVVTRLFDAPRELVWKVWTDKTSVTHWWGPNGFTTTTHATDFRVGGAWRFTMHGPDGTDYPNDVRYTEIVEPERLVYDHGFDDGGDPHFHATVTFDDQNGKTRVTLRLLAPTAEARGEMVKFGAVEGGNQKLGRLAEYLAAR